LAELAEADLLNRLAGWLQEQWLDEINARELGRDAIDLHWQTREADRIWRPVADGVGPEPVTRVDPAAIRTRSSGSDAELYDLYATLPSGRLVIRAGPGAGKTSVLLLLLVKALHQRQTAAEPERAGMPVPLLLSLAEWDPQESDLVEFAAQIAASNIPFLRGNGSGRGTDPEPLRNLIRSGKVALFLDGLDEMSTGSATAIARINAASPRSTSWAPP
jgi:predicted NACHT family NTPase